MKKFVLKFLLYFSPIFLLLVSLIFLDPFKVYFDYENPYKDSFVTLNRENVSVEFFKKNYDKERYDSFIFGNSRSQAYHCHNWLPYLSNGSKPYHFDANGEGVIGIRNKLKFLNAQEAKINNVLIVLDEDILNRIVEQKSHIYTIHPDLSDRSYLSYYSKFLKKSLNLYFLSSFLDYKLNGVKRDYMEGYI